MSLSILGIQENIEYCFREEINLDIFLIEDRQAKYIGPCMIEGIFVLQNRNIKVQAVCKQEVEFLCDRCLDVTKKCFEFEFECIYSEEEGEYRYSNSVVDLKDKVQEEFVILLPIQILCNDNCKGLCSSCGANLNHKECNCEVKNDIDESNPFSILMNKDFN